MKYARYASFAIALASAPSSAYACDGLTVANAWIREPPPVARVAAGYAVLGNSGDVAITIERVTSECCKHVMMHETIAERDHVRMSHLDTLTLEPGESVNFEPGGPHLMLMSPQQPLRHGDSVGLTFSCANGDTARLPFEIVKPQ